MPSADCMDAICAYVCLLSIFWCHSVSTNKVGVCSKGQEDLSYSTYKYNQVYTSKTWNMDLSLFLLFCLDGDLHTSRVTFNRWETSRRLISIVFDRVHMPGCPFYLRKQVIASFCCNKRTIYETKLCPSSQNWRQFASCIMLATYINCRLNSHKIKPLQQEDQQSQTQKHQYKIIEMHRHVFSQTSANWFDQALASAGSLGKQGKVKPTRMLQLGVPNHICL